MIQKIYDAWASPNRVRVKINVLDYVDDSLYSGLREWMKATSNPYIERTGVEEFVQQHDAEKTQVLQHIVDSATKHSYPAEKELFRDLTHTVSHLGGTFFIHNNFQTGKFVHGLGDGKTDTVTCKHYVYALTPVTLSAPSKPHAEGVGITERVAGEHRLAQYQHFLQKYSGTTVNMINASDRKICSLFVARQNAKYANKQDNRNIYFSAFPECRVTNYNPFGSTFCNEALQSKLMSGREVHDTHHNVFSTMYQSLQFLRRRQHFVQVSDEYRQKLIAFQSNYQQKALQKVQQRVEKMLQMGKSDGALPRISLHSIPHAQGDRTEFCKKYVQVPSVGKMWQAAALKWQTEMRSTPLKTYVSRQQTKEDWKSLH